jgi:hypothetical protein
VSRTREHRCPDGAADGDALCAQTDPEVSFPEKGQSAREARRKCRACPVGAECLALALRNNERFGVWACPYEAAP